MFDLEVHLLMTMRTRLKMSRKESLLHEKLAEHGLSIETANRLHRLVAEALGDDDHEFFTNLTKLVDGVDASATTVRFGSALWPDYTFNATAHTSGQLTSARYWRTEPSSQQLSSPASAEVWSMDVGEFEQHFGPVEWGSRSSLSDPMLPAYEECDFLWQGEDFGAGFSWGLFMFAARTWD